MVKSIFCILNFKKYLVIDDNKFNYYVNGYKLSYKWYYLIICQFKNDYYLLFIYLFEGVGTKIYIGILQRLIEIR